jgi:hypothetical protein
MICHSCEKDETACVCSVKRPPLFEMANADDPLSIVKAAQRSIIDSIRHVLAQTKELRPDVHGLTWEQIDDTLLRFREKEPRMIIQDGAM